MQIRKLQPHMDSALPNAKWNFDLHDSDHILRIDSDENVVMPVIELLTLHRHCCEELH